MIADPPSDDGAVQETTDRESAPDVAANAVGAPGTVAAMAGAVGVDAGPVPTALLAVTVKVEALPLVSPATVQLVVLVEHVNPPGADVTV